MSNQYIFGSLCRKANFQDKHFEIKSIPKAQWENADFILGNTSSSSNPLLIELTNGRMIPSMQGDQIVGALGVRFATLEATGTWEAIKEDGEMELLTGAGLIGKLSSKSVYVPELIELQYMGHVHIDGKKANMKDFVTPVEHQNYKTPTVLMVGTSMNAGKTTSARIIIRQLTNAGINVVGAKLTGAGRYRDILLMRDAGASAVYDFVDVGLPSSIVDPNEFKPSLDQLLSMIQSENADVAVVEIGASPLEPYNGKVAINTIKNNIACIVLCASDPYSVYGVMEAFGIKPDIVSGIATNTHAGISLIEKLCKVKALNLIDESTLPELRSILSEKLKLKL